jgi:hypothetical protein
MFFTDVRDLLTYFRSMRLTEHALREAHKEGLRARDVFHAVFNGQILERYYDRRRVLITGSSPRIDLQLHVVCDYTDEDEIVVITVYIPNRPTWTHDLVRAPLPTEVN